MLIKHTLLVTNATVLAVNFLGVVVSYAPAIFLVNLPLPRLVVRR